MSKKNVKEVDQTETIDSTRKSVIEDFNKSRDDGAMIDPDIVPTESDIEDAKKDYEDRTKSLSDKNDYFIADKDNSLRVAKFLKSFVSESIWAQRMFVGIINFNDYISKFIDECEKDPKELVMGYGEMQFAYLILENYGGIGLNSAMRMAEIWDEYVPIYDTFRDHIEWYKIEVEACKKLQERWSLMENGYYLKYADDDEIINHTVPSVSMDDQTIGI